MRESPSKVGRVSERGRNVVGEKPERGIEPRRGHGDLLRASTQKGLVLFAGMGYNRVDERDTE